MTLSTRSITLTAFGIMAAASTPQALAAQEIAEQTLQVAHIYDSGNIWYETTERFLDAVTQRTDGRVTFSVAPGGTTGTWEESIEALQLGTNDMVIQSIGTLDRYAPLPGIEAFPYLIRDLDHFNQVYFGELGAELFDDIEAATGFRIIGAGYRGARKLTANRPVETLEDLEGLALRVPPLRMYRRTWELLGASPEPMAFAEVFTSLQQGIIDGQENPLEVIADQRLDEVQDYVMHTDHVIGAMTFIFDSGRFESFSPELQEIMQEEGDAAMRWGTQRMIEQEAEYQADLEDRGMTFVEPDLPAFREAVAPIAEEFPELADWVDRIKDLD